MSRLIDESESCYCSNLLALLRELPKLRIIEVQLESVSHSSHNLFTPIFRHDPQALLANLTRPLATAPVPLWQWQRETAAASTYENKSVDGPRRLAPQNLEARVQTTHKTLIAAIFLNAYTRVFLRTSKRDFIKEILN